MSRGRTLFKPDPAAGGAGLTPLRGGVKLFCVEPPSTQDKKFWNKGRRRAFSNTLLTVFQVLLAGAVLGGVFGKFGFLSGVSLVVTLVVLFVVGLVAAAGDCGGPYV